MKDLEVTVKGGDQKAIVEGKTNVSFKTFVTLVLQRNVSFLYEKWQEEPIIMSSDLLSKLAAAPMDNTESTNHTILVTLGVGIIFGFFMAAVIGFFMLMFGFELNRITLLSVAICLLVLGLVLKTLMRMESKNNTQKLIDGIEGVARVLKK
jgi:hypothetical protein